MECGGYRWSSGTRRRVRRRRWIAAGLLLLSLLVVGAMAYPVLQGWTREPVEAREAALAAVNEARGSGADRRAPLALAECEQVLRSGLVEERRQASRFLSLRDFRQVSATFERARSLAREASAQALVQMESSRTEAEGAIENAMQAVTETGEVAEKIPLPSNLRHRLRTARIRVEEARILFDTGEFEEAIVRALGAAEDADAVWRQAIPLASRFTDPKQVRIWRTWVDETVRGSRQSGNAALVVSKEKNTLVLYVAGRAVRTYHADMGTNRLDVKQQAGDRATPEGRYRVVSKKGRGQSKYYKALLINYPNDDDRRRFEAARRAGEIPRGSKLGGLIEIHGEGGRGEDWTLGCVALSNSDMDDLFGRVPVGTPVTIVGGDGSGGAFSELVRNHSRPEFSRRP